MRRNERAIIEAAARALTADETASMQAIANAAGLSRLTLYRHFPTREALIAAMTDEMLEGMGAAAEAALAAPGPAADAVERLLCDLAEITARYPSILGPQPGNPSPAVLHFRRTFTALVDRGKADGSIDPSVDAVFLRQAALGGLSALMHCAPEGESELVDPGATIAGLLLAGVRPRPAR